LTGPVPAVQAIPGGQARIFTYTYSATSTGVFNFTGGVYGYDGNLYPLPVSASNVVAAANQVTVYQNSPNLLSPWPRRSAAPWASCAPSS